jgi:predicted nicotinamide N-methyase
MSAQSNFYLDGIVKYKVATQVFEIGPHSIEMTRLTDFESSVDQMYDYLKLAQREEELHTLAPYFAVIWPSAVVLAQTLLKLKPSEKDSFLEVGCGLGLPSKLALLLNLDTTMTDLHPDLPLFIEQNFSTDENSLFSNLKWTLSDWSQVSGQDKTEKELSPMLNRKFKWVVASDVLYEKKFIPQVARALIHFVEQDGTILVTDPGRPFLQDFESEMKKLGYSCHLEVKSEIFILQFVRQF